MFLFERDRLPYWQQNINVIHSLRECQKSVSEPGTEERMPASFPYQPGREEAIMEFTLVQTDALRELANIGAAHSARRYHRCSIQYRHECAEINVIDIADVSNFLSDEITTLVVFELQGISLMGAS